MRCFFFRLLFYPGEMLSAPFLKRGTNFSKTQQKLREAPTICARLHFCPESWASNCANEKVKVKPSGVLLLYTVIGEMDIHMFACYIGISQM